MVDDSEKITKNSYEGELKQLLAQYVFEEKECGNSNDEIAKTIQVFTLNFIEEYDKTEGDC